MNPVWWMSLGPKNLEDGGWQKKLVCRKILSVQFLENEKMENTERRSRSCGLFLARYFFSKKYFFKIFWSKMTKLCNKKIILFHLKTKKLMLTFAPLPPLLPFCTSDEFKVWFSKLVAIKLTSIKCWFFHFGQN